MRGADCGNDPKLHYHMMKRGNEFERRTLFRYV